MKKVSIFALFTLVSLPVGLVACSDDDGGNNQAVCGNGVIEGTEVCDQTNLNGQDCTSIEGNFTGGTLTCSNSCTFVTTQCTTGNEQCNNDILEAGEDCDGSLLGTATCQTVGNYVGGTLGCTTTCDFDVSQCVPPAGCGDGAVDAGEDCDGVNLDGNDCTTIGGNYTGGTLTCNGDCTFNESQCTTTPPTCGNGTLDTGEECEGTNLGGQTCADVGPYLPGVGTLACDGTCHFDTTQCVPSPSAQIQVVLTTGEATSLSLPVQGAWVTYLKPALGNVTNDPAGFFLQADPTGPALFVAVDPATLSPPPVVGDEVDLTVTETVLARGILRVTALTGYSRVSQGNDVTTLTQDVTNAADLVTNVGDYTVELITATFTVMEPFANAGQAHQAAMVNTTAITGTPVDLEFRLPTSLVAALGLDNGCTATVSNTPLWRFDGVAQISAYDAAEVAVQSCAAPQVVSAVATAADTVVVTFNRDIDPASVLANGSQFTFDNGLTASAATASGPDVTVTTSTQTGGVTYTVTVASTVEDSYNVGVDTNANTATFLGFVTFASQLYIWEMDTDQVGNPDPDEFVELWNNTGAAIDFSTDKYFLLFLNGGATNDVLYMSIQLTGTLAANDVLVVGKAPVPNVDILTTGDIQQGADGILLVQCNTCDDNAVAEFPVDSDVGAAATFTSANGHQVTKIDAIAYDTNDPDDAGLMTKLGVTAQWDEGEGGSSTTQSLQRASATTWVTSTPTPGVL